MAFSVLSVTVIFIFFIALIVRIHIARSQGLKKTMMAFANIAVSLVVSVLISPLVSRFTVDRLHPILSQTSIFKAFGGSEAMDVFMKAFISIVASTVVYLLLFFIIRIIIAVSVNMIIPPRDPSDPDYDGGNDTWLNRNAGIVTVILGALNAFIITMAVTAPVMGTLHISCKAIDLVASVTEDEVLEAEDEQILRELRNDIPGNLFYQLGGKMIYYSAASTDIYGDRVYLINELKTIEKTAVALKAVIPALENPNELKDEDIENINKVCKNVKKVRLASGILADVMSEWSTAWLNGRSYMGVKMPQMSRSLQNVFYEILVVCAGTDVHSAKENVATLLNVMVIISDSGMLKLTEDDFVSLMNLVSEGRVIDKIDAELAKNPNMYSVRRKLSSIVLSGISQQINVNKFGPEQYFTLLNQLAESVTRVREESITYEQQISDLAGYTQEHIGNYGIALTDYIADIAAETLLVELSALNGEITESDIADFFNSFK